MRPAHGSSQCKHRGACLISIACYFLLVLLIFTDGAAGDLYLHNPRGSNNKLNEANNNRNNANRLFDSQNNAAGGYQVGDACIGACSNAAGTYDATAEGAGKGVMYYYTGSILNIEWTNQHACGSNPYTHCEIIIQYMCEEDSPGIRDGTTTNTIPLDPVASQQPQYGQHETYEYYQKCRARDRNKGLFLADQFDTNDNSRRSAIYTRQDRNGNRYGFECPEERDYYPYWHPTPWRDIAILTSDTSRCAYYRRESQNVAYKGECSIPQYNNMKDCVANRGFWDLVSHNIDPPECLAAPWSRDNHLGNTLNGHAASYNWTIPDTPSEACILRLRYNISTADYDGWSTFAEHNQNSPVTNTPAKDFLGLGNNVTGPLRLAINSDQLGRTFQDRSHVFRIRRRPAGIPKSAKIYNVNVRGRRGNIVQVYPSVEYDFVPQTLRVSRGDYVHFQWTGSDANAVGNTGEGRAMTDRSNIVQLESLNKNYPKHWTQVTMFTKENGEPDQDLIARMAFLNQEGCDLTTNDPNSIANCKVLNRAAAYFDGGLIRMNNPGTFYYGSTRNNQFSNRSQKATLIVTMLSTEIIILIVVLCILGTVGVITSAFCCGGFLYAKKNPASSFAQHRHVRKLFRIKEIKQDELDVLLDDDKDAPKDKSKKPVKKKKKFAFFWEKLSNRQRFLILYFLMCIIIYLYGFFSYVDYIWVRNMPFFPIAKGGGNLLNFTCSLILFPVMRNIISWFRLSPIANIVPLDDNILFHKLIALTTLIAAFIHIGAHIVNYWWSTYYLRANLASLIVSRAGITGIIITVLMGLMMITALERVRRSVKKITIRKTVLGGYDLFWYMHQLYIVVLALLWIHGTKFWIWSLWPILLFITEKIIHLYRSKDSTEVVRAVLLPSDVMRIEMKKKAFFYKPGQYIFLNCPAISKYEWHPFTITSAPEMDLVTCHIRCRGDWTRALKKHLIPSPDTTVVTFDPRMDAKLKPFIRVDGPYGSASEHVFDHKTVMMVGAGIGITPFASIMKSIQMRCGHLNPKTAKEFPNPHRAYFYWVCRDKEEFDWFSGLLSEIEDNSYLDQIFVFQTYITGTLDLKEYEAQKGKDRFDISFAGRPNWRNIFRDVAKKHAGETIGVYLCGPAPLAKELAAQSEANSTDETVFIFRKENF